MEKRIQRVTDDTKASREVAEKLIERSDHDKRGFARFAFGEDWLNLHLYDLVVNTDKLSVDAMPCRLVPQDVFQNFYDITQIPRPSGQMDQIREFLVEFGESLSLETVVDEAGNVIIRKPAAAGFENRQGVVLQAHMDMVAQGGSDYDPATDSIQAYVDGDYIVTQGTTLGADDGIGLALAMTILKDQSLQAGPIEALFTVDEETNLSGADGLSPDTLQGRILINLDNEWEGTFVIGAAGGEQGNLRFLG